MIAEEIFGLNAGKVWHVLKGNGPMTIQKISSKACIDEKGTYGALGWLSREGKIKVVETKNALMFELTE
jgi:hypothetical protein